VALQSRDHKGAVDLESGVHLERAIDSTAPAANRRRYVKSAMLNSNMNPYASYLGTRDPFQVLASTPAELSSLFTALGPEGATLSLAPGKWSVREILAHLADNEMAFGFRLRQALADPHHVIQPYDQESWAARYSAYDAPSALATLTVTRNWNMKLLGTVTPADLAKPLTHPERGAMTLKVLIETIAGHDLNHLGQIRTIAERARAA
jgi:hypothetical protein